MGFTYKLLLCWSGKTESLSLSFSVSRSLPPSLSLSLCVSLSYPLTHTHTLLLSHFRCRARVRLLPEVYVCARVYSIFFFSHFASFSFISILFTVRSLNRVLETYMYYNSIYGCIYTPLCVCSAKLPISAA